MKNCEVYIRFLVSFFARFLARFFDRFLCGFLCRFFLKVDLFDCDQSSVGNRNRAAAAQCYISGHRLHCRVDDEILQVQSRLCCYPRRPHILFKIYPHLCPRGVSPGHEKVGRPAPLWIFPYKQANPFFHVVLERCWWGAKQTNQRVSS